MRSMILPAGLRQPPYGWIHFDFQVPAANKKLAGGFGSNGTKYAWSSSSADPIGDLLDIAHVVILIGNILQVGRPDRSKFSGQPIKLAGIVGFLRLNARIVIDGAHLF